jgi:hypothetical protein
VYLRFKAFCGRLADRVLIPSILVSFCMLSFVYGAISLFSENGFRVMLMYCRLELSILAWCIYILLIYIHNYLLGVYIYIFC